MYRKYEMNLLLVLLISGFLHITVMVGLLVPDYSHILNPGGKTDEDDGTGRDIIMNINQDKKSVVTRRTLLSDEDSSARGFITHDRGDHWLNNSLKFSFSKAARRSGKQSRSKKAEKEEKIVLSDSSEVQIEIVRDDTQDPSMQDDDLSGDFIRVPDRNSFSMKNAIFYSNDGRFSFNTKKFKNFRYFMNMKNKIASNWFPPPIANSIFSGYSPGTTRIMAIPSQVVKIYFVINRNGDVMKVVLVDSQGNEALDSSCVDSIKLSKSFGPVPEEIKGQTIVIRFMFGYIVQ